MTFFLLPTIQPNVLLQRFSFFFVGEKQKSHTTIIREQKKEIHYHIFCLLLDVNRSLFINDIEIFLSQGSFQMWLMVVLGFFVKMIRQQQGFFICRTSVRRTLTCSVYRDNRHTPHGHPNWNWLNFFFLLSFHIIWKAIETLKNHFFFNLSLWGSFLLIPPCLAFEKDARRLLTKERKKMKNTE